jgi:hypothetical protein
VRVHLWLLLLAGCGSTASDPVPAGPCGSLDALAVMSDGTSSRVSAFSLDGGSTAPVKGSDLGNDPSLSASGGRQFYVARDTARVFELDGCGRPQPPITVSDPESSKGATNPQDVAVAPDGSLWIARFGVPTLAVVEPSGARRKTIDLSSFDGDGNPNANAIQIVEVGGSAKAFVTLGRLDNHDPLLRSKQPSFAVRLDVTTGAIEGSIELQGRNPFSVMVPHEGGLWMALPGVFDAADESIAGIERLDPATFSSRLVVRERELGGSVIAVAFAAGCGAAIVADPTPTVNATSVVTFDPESGTVLAPARAPVMSTAGYDLWSLTWKNDVLLVGDRRRTGGGYPVHAFRREGKCDLHALPDTIFLSAPPVAIRGFML